jgi:hypothetical protein
VSGYVEAGYVIGLGTLALYGASIVGRERAARRRLKRPDAVAASTERAVAASDATIDPE